MLFSFNIFIRYQYHILRFNSVFGPNYCPKLFTQTLLQDIKRMLWETKKLHYESPQLILCYLLFMLWWQLLLILNKATVRSNYYFLSFRSGKQSFALHLSNFLSQNITTLINPRTTVMAWIFSMLGTIIHNLYPTFLIL